jgi:hypothetical protein
LKNKSEAAEFLYISEAILPQPDVSGGKPDFSSYENVAFSFYAPSKGKLKLSISAEDGTSIYTKNIIATTGLNTYSWDFILGPNIDDNPYLFNFVKLPKAGDYTIRLIGEKLNIESAFSIKGK